MISHAYKCSSDLQFKCDECEFWGPNSLTMEVHVKKLHSEKINCGLCNYEASELESLETHMNTCEIYKCSDCKKSVKTLIDMKNHLRNEHNGKVVYITHI